MKKLSHTTVLENIPVQIYQPVHTMLHTSFIDLLSRTKFYIHNNTPIEPSNTATIHITENISKKIYALHPFSIMKVKRTLLHTIKPSLYIPSLIFTVNSQKHIGIPAIPCITWHIENDYILFLISHTLIKDRNSSTTELQDHTHITLLLHSKPSSSHEHTIKLPLLCYVHPNDIYSTLALLKSYASPHDKHTIIIHDTIDIDHILEQKDISYYREILISYYFLQNNPNLLYLLQKHKIHVSSIHGLQNIICGLGTCRLCVEVQEKNNYEICKRGIFQKIL